MNESRVLFLGKANTAPPLVVLHFRLPRRSLLRHASVVHHFIPALFHPLYVEMWSTCAACVGGLKFAPPNINVHFMHVLNTF